jgi:hypothetical protein
VLGFSAHLAPNRGLINLTNYVNDPSGSVYDSRPPFRVPVLHKASNTVVELFTWHAPLGLGGIYYPYAHQCADSILRGIIGNGVGILAGDLNGTASQISGEYSNAWKSVGHKYDHVMTVNGTVSNGVHLDELKSDADHYAVEAKVTWP